MVKLFFCLCYTSIRQKETKLFLRERTDWQSSSHSFLLGVGSECVMQGCAVSLHRVSVMGHILTILSYTPRWLHQLSSTSSSSVCVSLLSTSVGPSSNFFSQSFFFCVFLCRLLSISSVHHSRAPLPAQLCLLLSIFTSFSFCLFVIKSCPSQTLCRLNNCEGSPP